MHALLSARRPGAGEKVSPGSPCRVRFMPEPRVCFLRPFRVLGAYCAFRTYTNTLGDVQEGSGILLYSPKPTESMEKSSSATHVGDEFAGLLVRTDKTGSESQQVFHEVLDQLTAQEDDLGIQTSLYTLPSMNFLESLLEEMDSRNASNGIIAEPPIYLPMESLDLPGLELAGAGTLEDLGLQSPGMLQKPAYSCPAAAMAHHGSGFPSQGNMGLIRNPSINHPSPFIIAPTAGSAAPSPTKRPTTYKTDDYDEEALEYCYETSKSGRCRKVSSFVSGQKRKSHMISQYVTNTSRLSLSCPLTHPPTHSLTSNRFAARRYSAPAVVGGHNYQHLSGVNGAEINPYVSEVTEVASKYTKKGQKNRRSKTTVCLNCGSMDTPQWRVGPLGPRTLCNACGVRYKKGLPLSCYPLRNGMVLPPGAVLPPSVIVPPGMNIITQPLNPTTAAPAEGV
jgi:hypothetical protein